MDSALGPPRKMTDRREELTPMMAQYYELCAQYDDALILFQVGDFYEAFCEAAETVARRCEVTLTKREDSTGQYAMAGLPIENIESYVDRLLEAGYHVAIADQVEDPEETTGVVDRAVTRVLTPGTLTENELLDTDRNNYVGAVTNGEKYGVAVLDVSTGDFYATSTDTPQLLEDELSRFDPAEVLLGPEIPEPILPDDCLASQYDQTAFELQEARSYVEKYFGSSDRHLESTAELRACGALLSYAEYARAGENGRLEYLNHLTRYDPHDYMLLDAVALQSLELFERRTVYSHENGTLAGVIDETASALGRRKLDAWLRRPLTDETEISARHDAVEELRDTVTVREELYSQLRRVYDIERLISRISRERATARDLRSLKETLDVVPQVRTRLADCSSQKLQTLRDDLDTLDDIRTLIEDAILPNPAREITEGGIINPAFDDDLERLRKTEQDGKAWVDTLEKSERERTGIDSLKVGHNSVHGYYIEITDANLDRVPSEYERRQTLKNAERYYTPELKDREDEILRAEQLADELEYELFCAVRSDVAAVSERIQRVADALAELDVLVSFATVAAEYDYTRPEMSSRTGATENNSAEGTGCLDGIHIEGGRHPVVERTEESFVPNPTTLDDTARVAVITGPNMSGKSTYMRQVALIVILAQVGSFVPATDAKLGIVDRIFTRVGASDDIAGGRSTFMVEMTELAEILEHASAQSLVLLDEVGRGTSTTDGFAIAQAVTEYIHDQTGALALFATHHHDLTAVAETLDSAYNLYFRTTRTEQGVEFQHTVERGTADASYGVEVAATAGVPGSVVERAREVLDSRAPKGTQSQPSDQQPVKARANGSGDSHTYHTENAPREALEEALCSVDIATMTPLDALTLLAELQQRIENEGESIEAGPGGEPDLQ